MFFILKKKNMYPAYNSKHNSNCAKQVFLLMIPNGEEWHYSCSKKKSSALLRGIKSKNNSYFNCLNCVHPFRTRNKLQSYKTACENKDFCKVIMPCKDIETLEFN